MQDRRWVYAFIVSFAGGVLFRSFFDFGAPFIIFLFALAVALFLTDFLRHLDVRGLSKKTLLAALVFTAFGAGLLRFSISDFGEPDTRLQQFIGTRVAFEGVVVREPDEREGSTRLTLRVDTLTQNTKPRMLNIEETRVLVVADLYPQYRYGDELRVAGQLVRPENFRTETGRVFDYVTYLAKDDVFYQVFRPEIEVLSEDNGSFLKRSLFDLKTVFVHSLDRLLPQPHAALASGLIVGSRQGLGRELQDAFRAVGLIHIVVLSGYNVTIIAEHIQRFFNRFLSRRTSLAVAALGIVLFAIMVGGSATVVRASIMALIVLLARATGRTYDMLYALFVAGFLMVLADPRITAFDASFQLSFLATLSLILVAPHVGKLFGWMPSKLGLREAATATISTQLFVLPLLLFMTGEISVVAPIVNILVLPTVPYTMFFGFFTGVVGFVSAFLAAPLAWVTTALLAYELWVVDLFSSFSFAAVALPAVSFGVVLVIYATYAAVLLRIRQQAAVKLRP